MDHEELLARQRKYAATYRARHKERLAKERRANHDRLSAIQKKYRKTSVTYNKANRRNYKIRNPEKFKAGIDLRRAVRRGKIAKPSYCAKCLKPCNPEGHHSDYSKPLEVIWVCRKCHQDIHLGEI